MNYLNLDANRTPIVEGQRNNEFKITFEGNNTKGSASQCSVSLNEYQIFTIMEKVTQIVKSRESYQKWILTKLKSSAE